MTFNYHWIPKFQAKFILNLNIFDVQAVEVRFVEFNSYARKNGSAPIVAAVIPVRVLFLPISCFVNCFIVQSINYLLNFKSILWVRLD